MKKAVVLLSGGLDSATAAALARAQGYVLYGLSLSYGQTHECELQAAKKLAQFLGFREHRLLHLPIGDWGGSALVGSAAKPLDRSLREITAGGIPPTYVPARNTVFLSLALAWAEVLQAEAIFIGVNALDYSGYPDCRPEFIAAFERLAQLATKASAEEGHPLKIHAPLLHLSKAQIVREAYALGLDFTLTHSCYFPGRNGLACGRCDACRLRRKGFEEAGMKDPIAYQA
jgi:7-cyano-7-deazaguanine synthase